MASERFTNAIQVGPAIHGEAVTGDPEGFGDRRLNEPTLARSNGVDHRGPLSESRVSVNEIVKDDPLGYAEVPTASKPVFDGNH